MAITIHITITINIAISITSIIRIAITCTKIIIIIIIHIIGEIIMQAILLRVAGLLLLPCSGG
jgi:hypothetical protein